MRPRQTDSLVKDVLGSDRENAKKKKKKDFVVLDGMVNPQYQDEIKLLL